MPDAGYRFSGRCVMEGPATPGMDTPGRARDPNQPTSGIGHPAPVLGLSAPPHAIPLTRIRSPKMTDSNDWEVAIPAYRPLLRTAMVWMLAQYSSKARV